MFRILNDLLNVESSTEVIHKNKNGEDKELFLWLHKNGINITLDRVIEYNDELQDDNYIKIKNLFLYKEDEDICEYIYNLLEKKAENIKEILNLFTIEEITELWIDGFTVEEAMEELAEKISIEKVLKKPSEIAYKSVTGDTVRFINLDEEM